MTYAYDGVVHEVRWYNHVGDIVRSACGEIWWAGAQGLDRQPLARDVHWRNSGLRYVAHACDGPVSCVRCLTKVTR